MLLSKTSSLGKSCLRCNFLVENLGIWGVGHWHQSAESSTGSQLSDFKKTTTTNVGILFQSKTILSWNSKANQFFMVGHQLDDEPNLYMGNGWKSPFPSIYKWLFRVPGCFKDVGIWGYHSLRNILRRHPMLSLRFRKFRKNISVLVNAKTTETPRKDEAKSQKEQLGSMLR